MLAGLTQIPLGNRAYVYLIAANIGAVIMPWMIFYQQSAIADKRLGPEDYGAAKVDTAIGAVIAQLVMAAILVAAAATIGRSAPGASLDTIGQLSAALVPSLGVTAGRLVFSLGTIGAAMVASIVVSLATAWGFGEVTGYKHSLEHRPAEAPWFYGIYTAAVIGGAAAVALAPDLVSLNIGVEVMNALLLPLVLGFLVLLAVRALPHAHRLRGAYLWLVVGLAVVVAGLGVYGGISGAGLL
jgi:Mn2+/Fe2+ NRAMP family transporter